MNLINIKIAHISFSVDGKWIGTIPVGDGFFRRGRFTGYNPWANGTLMAPFDQEVYFNYYFCL